MKDESLDALGAIPVEIIVQTEPIIVHQGRYRLYKKPDGGIHLVYQRDDKSEPDHLELPAGLMVLAQSAGEGKLSLSEMLKEMMKLRSSF